MATLVQQVNNIDTNLLPNEEIGQFWTPNLVADYMASLICKYSNTKLETIIDPAVGPATFIASLYRKGILNQTTSIYAYDIDHRMVDFSNSYIKDNRLEGCSYNKDYILTKLPKEKKADLVIMNPPYIRHEKIDAKTKLEYRNILWNNYEETIDGRSNLYIYFLLKALSDLKTDGLLCAIVYDGLRNSRYGQKALELLGKYGNILSIESIKTPFHNVIVDASIILIRKSPKNKNKNEQLVSIVNNIPKGFVKLETLVNVKRGTGLLNTKVFMASQKDPCYEEACIFIKKQAGIKGLSIQQHPEKAYLFECETKVSPKLSKLLSSRVNELINSGSQSGLKVLLENRSKNPDRWFIHKSVTAPIIFNYYLRKRPKHLYNHNRYSIADNFYGVTPNDISDKVAWLLLNSKVYCDAILENARPQGNGLMKLQVYEYKQANVPDWRLFSSEIIVRLSEIADNVLFNEIKIEKVDKQIEALINREIRL